MTAKIIPIRKHPRVEIVPMNEVPAMPGVNSDCERGFIEGVIFGATWGALLAVILGALR